MKAGLIIIDVQEAYVGRHRGTQKFNETFNYINETSKLFRQAKLPVVVVRDIEGGDGEELKNVAELETVSSDKEILKVYNNSFWKTDLEGYLKELDVDFLVLCGNAAEFCVLATYNGAEERDFPVTILQHGVFARYPEGLQDLYENRALISHRVLSNILK